MKTVYTTVGCVHFLHRVTHSDCRETNFNEINTEIPSQVISQQFI